MKIQRKSGGGGGRGVVCGCERRIEVFCENLKKIRRGGGGGGSGRGKGLGVGSGLRVNVDEELKFL